jgi:hypothetical protein
MSIRLGAVWLVANVLATMPRLLVDISQLKVGGSIRYELYFDAAFVLLGILLWLYPGVLARLAVRASTNEVFESPLSAQDILRIGLSILGVWFVIHSCNDLVYYGMVASAFGEYAGASLSGKQKAAVVADLAQVFLGVMLTLQSRGLIGLIERLRYAPYARSAPQSEGEKVDG